MTYYEILEVSENASDEVIRMAYKALVKKYHPDVFKGDQQIADSKIKEINMAFDVLSNKQKKKEYDDFLYYNRHKNESNQKSKEPSRNDTPNMDKDFRKPTETKKWTVLGICFVMFFLLISGGKEIAKLLINNDSYVDDNSNESSPQMLYDTTYGTGVNWISDYRFLYYSEESMYVLLFELSDVNENTISAEGSVDIRIVNDSGATVYKETKHFSAENFESWTYDGTRDMYVAAIYINPEEIVCGNTANGMVYFIVSGRDYRFDELSLLTYELPFKNNNAENVTISQPQEKYTCLEYTCDTIVSASGVYCPEHKCEKFVCIFAKKYDSKYCLMCECSNAICKNLKLDAGNYCEEHTCRALQCYYERKVNSDFCFLHERN